jgi:D-alanyl-D-alanine dipeptidase
MVTQRPFSRLTIRISIVLALTLAFAKAQTAPQTFTITPLRPIVELRAEALKATPPEEHGDFRANDLVELTTLDPSIKLDIHYASANNFLGEPVYTQARAFLQRPAAEALVRANQKLQALGLGLLVFDGYRPWYVTRIFWDATPPKLHN